MERNELKPCPFCGGKAKLTTECCGQGFYIEQKYVCCSICGARGGVADSYDENNLEVIAIERWERRANDGTK